MWVRVLNISGSLVVGRSLKACWHVTKVELKALWNPLRLQDKRGFRGQCGGKEGMEICLQIKGIILIGLKIQVGLLALLELMGYHPLPFSPWYYYDREGVELASLQVLN